MDSEDVFVRNSQNEGSAMSSTEFVESAQSIFALMNPEVWIITAADGNRRGGLLATWVRRVSIDPAAPTLAIAIDTNHFTADLITASGTFVAHLVRPD